MQPHKIKRKAVNSRSADYDLESSAPRGNDRAYARSPSKGPLASNPNTGDGDSRPPFPVLSRGGAVPQHSSAHQNQSPSGPRAPRYPSTNADESAGPQQSNRLDTERQVAFPPSSGPRAPIRNAASTGLTSVHIGVKPRILGEDTADSTTVRMKKDDLVSDMNGYERAPAVPGRVYRSQTEPEEIPGVGMGYGRKTRKAMSEDEDDGETAFTASSVSSGSGRNGHSQGQYRPQTAQPTVSIAEQAAKYDADYRARLKRGERGSDRRNNVSLEDDAYWQESILNDDPRIEGIYTFDYSPNPPGKKKGRSKEDGSKSRITEYEDPSRPGVVMKSRSYLPPPVDERSYGVPAGRRVRAFIREKEKLEGQSIGPAPSASYEKIENSGRSEPKAHSVSSEEQHGSRTLPPAQSRRIAQPDRGSITPKASKVALVEAKPAPTSSRSNPDLKQRMAENERQRSILEQEYEDDEERFRQKVRRMRSEPRLGTETVSHDRHVRYETEPRNDERRDFSKAELWNSSEPSKIPPMPEGEEYDEDTEKERQEAWKQYYAAMQMYSGSPMASPGGAAYMGSIGNSYTGLNAAWSTPSGIHQSNGYPGGMVPQGEAGINYEMKPEVPRKHRTRERREDQSSRPKSRQQKDTNSSLALTGMGTPSKDFLPTPMYPQSHAESYFGYEPYATQTHAAHAQLIPFSNAYVAPGYNAANDPFAMHNLGANLPRMDGMGMMPTMRNKKSWYAGI